MLPPPCPSWLLRGLGDEPLVVQTFDAPRDPEWEVLHPMFVVGYLERWIEEPLSRSILIDIHATVFGSLNVAAWAHADEHRWLKTALRIAFERLDLIVLVQRGLSTPISSPTLPTSVPPTPTPTPKPPKLKTFIEIVLLDSDGKPASGEAFKVTLPDGTQVTGNLDEKGFKRIDGIDPGTCDIEFPNIDGREWGPSPFGGAGRAGAS